MLQNAPESMPGSSSKVRLWLESDAGTISLSQVGSDFIIAAEACELAPYSTAWVVVSINGNTHRSEYVILNGLSGENRRSKTAYCHSDGLPI